MQISHTINDKTIYVQVNYENTYYDINIENNIINKSFIENNKFMFRLHDNILLMYDDNNKFMLDKMECNYSVYIETNDRLKYTKEQLEHTQKELEQTTEQLEQTTEQLEHTKEQLEHTKEQLEHTKEQLEHTQKELEQIKNNNINNNENLLHQQYKTKLKQIKNEINNTNHLIQQQLRIYYDKDTKQMKISELPYIMFKDKITGIEKFLYDKSKLLCDDGIIKKINNFVVQEKWKKHYAKIRKSIEIGNLVNRNMVQVIIPPNKMLKLWTTQCYPTNYTSGIYNLQFTSCPVWYGDINHDDDFHYVIDDMMKTVFKIL